MRALAARAENALAALALGGIMLLPLAEIAMRARSSSTGIPGAAAVHAEPDAVGRPARRRDRRARGQAADARHRRVPSEGTDRRASPTCRRVGGRGDRDDVRRRRRRAGARPSGPPADIIAVDVPVWISTLAFPIGVLGHRRAPGLACLADWRGRAIAALGIVAGFLAAQHYQVLRGRGAAALDRRRSSSPACSARRSSRCSAASRWSRSSPTAAGRSCR